LPEQARFVERRRFPDEHAVPALQGYPYPSWSQVKRACAQRCAWLDQKIGRLTATGSSSGSSRFLLHELASLVWLVEEAERRRSAWRRDAPPRGVPCLVTALDEVGARRVVLASAAVDGGVASWSSGGSPLPRVVAWAPVPEAAESAGAEPGVGS
jgi:hypothetical protein